jgi:anti-sigma factor RsiW
MHSLTGAYVLNAVEGAERRRFEAHLTGCPACAREVAELRATASRLGVAVARQPPPRLRERVLAELRRTHQERPGTPRWHRRTGMGSRGWPIRLTAAAAVLGVLGAGWWKLHRAATRTGSASVQPTARPYSPPCTAPTVG